MSVNLTDVNVDALAVRQALLNVDQPVYASGERAKPAISNVGSAAAWATAGAVRLEDLGDPEFKRTYGVRYAYMTGAMANGIASAELVIAMGQAGFLGSFGAAGMVPARIEAGIQKVQAALPNGPYAFNLIHSPSEEVMEKNAVALYLKYNVTTVEASAFLD